MKKTQCDVNDIWKYKSIKPVHFICKKNLMSFFSKWSISICFYLFIDWLIWDMNDINKYQWKWSIWNIFTHRCLKYALIIKVGCSIFRQSPHFPANTIHVSERLVSKINHNVITCDTSYFSDNWNWITSVHPLNIEQIP